MLNLSNILSIINLIYTLNDNEKFKKYLYELGIYISFEKRNDNNDMVYFVLLNKINCNLYFYISCYGNVGFTNSEYNKLAIDFCNNADKYGYDDGYSF